MRTPVICTRLLEGLSPTSSAPRLTQSDGDREHVVCVRMLQQGNCDSTGVLWVFRAWIGSSTFFNLLFLLHGSRVQIPQQPLQPHKLIGWEET